MGISKAELVASVEVGAVVPVEFGVMAHTKVQKAIEQEAWPADNSVSCKVLAVSGEGFLLKIEVDSLNDDEEDQDFVYNTGLEGVLFALDAATMGETFRGLLCD